jgi:D-psicose/D-tagatose/L-ribulose 3-epimerase
MDIGCHSLVWNGSLDADRLENSIARTRDAGFDLVELPLMDPDSFDTQAARKFLADYGVRATASLGLTAATDLSSDNREVSANGERLLNKCLDIVSDLESTYLCGVLYSAMQKYMAPATADGRRNSAEAIHRLAERAQSLGVRIGLEVVNRYETNIMNTASEGLRFLDSVDHANAYLHLDTYHMNIEEPDMFSPVLDAADRLGYVHIGESHRGYLGSGSVDFGSFFRALERIGFDGPIVFESFSSAVVDGQLSNTLGIWRNLWRDSDDLGVHANSFIRSQLQTVHSIQHH